MTNTSSGRFPDGADTDSNCIDFQTQAVATLAVASSTEPPISRSRVLKVSALARRPG